MENQYLKEDQHLLDELKSIGPLSTGIALEEQKRKIEIVHIKAFLKSRKSAKETEVSNTRFSNIILIFTVIQVLLGILQFTFSVITAEKNSLQQWIGIISLFGLLVCMRYLFKLIRNDE